MDSFIHGVKKITLKPIDFQGDKENPSTYTRDVVFESEDGKFEFNLFSKTRECLEVEITEVKKL